MEGKTPKKFGFTLIELLVVIGIIAILSVTVYVALNPAKRFSEARNSRRYADVQAILNAVHQCLVDNGGTLATCGITDTSSHSLGTSGWDLSQELAAYLKTMPLDPSSGTAAVTGYTIIVDSNNIVTFTASLAELSKEIKASR